MDQGRQDAINRGYRTITVTGVALLVTVAVLFTFAVGWLRATQAWPELPLGAGWTDAFALVVAVIVPLSARIGSEWVIMRTTRSRRGTKFVVAMQVVSWVTLGIWASFQVPLLIGLVLAILHHRALFLLPFFIVSGVAALIVAPGLLVWDEWFEMLEHPLKRTRIRTV